MTTLNFQKGGNQTRPRLDLASDILFRLSLYSIYLSPNPVVVASVLNQRLKPTPRLTSHDIIVTYVHLHDTENELWARARDMNQREKESLRAILEQEGVEEKFLSVEPSAQLGL